MSYHFIYLYSVLCFDLIIIMPRINNTVSPSMNRWRKYGNVLICTPENVCAEIRQRGDPMSDLNESSLFFLFVGTV